MLGHKSRIKVYKHITMHSIAQATEVIDDIIPWHLVPHLLEPQLLPAVVIPIQPRGKFQMK